MRALIPFGLTGRATWLGVVPSRSAALASEPRERLALTLEGPVGEDHGGATRPSCSRVSALYPRGTTIRNARQLSVVSVEEMQVLASRMGLDRVDPAWLGATMAVAGIPDWSHVPPSSRLRFAGGACIVVDMQNVPCHLPVPVIEAARAGKGRAFKTAAAGLRGVTAWVERDGDVSRGETFALFGPAQRAWRGGSAEGQAGGDREQEPGGDASLDDEGGGGHGGAPGPGVGDRLPTA